MNGPDRGALHAGDGLVGIDWIATGVFGVSAAAGTVFDGPIRVASVAVALLLFVAGCVAFLMAYFGALERSRTEAIGIGGLFFLAGEDTAPAQVRRSLRLALVAQSAIALVTASIRPYTGLAFGILVPMFGLGMMGLWGARHGGFGPRAES